MASCAWKAEGATSAALCKGSPEAGYGRASIELKYIGVGKLFHFIQGPITSGKMGTRSLVDIPFKAVCAKIGEKIAKKQL